jgi:hypothetical protein
MTGAETAGPPGTATLGTPGGATTRLVAAPPDVDQWIRGGAAVVCGEGRLLVRASVDREFAVTDSIAADAGGRRELGSSPP